jgi:formylglycine-generating enzyme required for sulfatase activity
MNSSNLYRNSIDIQTPANSTTLAPAVYACNLTSNTTYNAADDGEWIACNSINWMDGAAYLDWAGLRPMTELEYEKACRGNKAAVSSENAWGNTTIAQASGISSGGTNAETASNAGANCVYGAATNVQCPLRVGAFAGAATTRTQAGATYYGIMEMSGNLMEFVVHGSDKAGNSYTGLHGDGKLLGVGTANVSFWPGINGNLQSLTANTAFGGTTGITSSGGAALRGGSYITNGNYTKVSDRAFGPQNQPDGIFLARDSEYGIRGVRNAP